MEPGSSRRLLPKNLGLLELISAKKEGNWKPSVEEMKQGFRGWHQRGYLPHFDAPGVTQMVTFHVGGLVCYVTSAGMGSIFETIR